VFQCLEPLQHSRIGQVRWILPRLISAFGTYQTSLQEIDFDSGGFKHSMRVDWMLREKASGRELDHRVYTFAPGKGLVNLR
jgi:hypothetical protein